MSIALLTQVYDETRRLAIAGSMVAAGDFRLKKLVPPLEQAGAKAPVFGKVAQAVKGVVDATDQTSAEALLELSNLVNAILYTQGETGRAGELKPIETTDLGTTATQTSARTLQPLLEALSSTGSGRLEIIRDAVHHDAFRDLRLVKPSLAALDDSYSEIADLISAKVLPLYGKAILPELRAKFELKGKQGHARRLKLMHQLDPAGTRELVKQALDEGSKEVKMAAIECLDREDEDLAYLLEQARSKNQEVRGAAYQALARSDSPEAHAVLQKALTGKDLNLVLGPLQRHRKPAMCRLVVDEVERLLAELPGLKDKKAVGEQVQRALVLLRCLVSADDAATEATLLRLFAAREKIAALKGTDGGGQDINAMVANLMAHATAKTRQTLAHAHASLSPDELEPAFYAARSAMPAAAVFEMFSPYYLEDPKKSKKKGHRAAIVHALKDPNSPLDGVYYYALPEPREKVPPLDPRWLDLALAQQDALLVCSLATPGHPAAASFLAAQLGERMTTAKDANECYPLLQTMVRTQHPGAAGAVAAVIAKYAKKASWHLYWVVRLVSELPPSAIAALEPLLPELAERDANALMDALEQLRQRGKKIEA